jgi:hypothetical protein
VIFQIVGQRQIHGVEHTIPFGLHGALQGPACVDTDYVTLILRRDRANSRKDNQENNEQT